MSRRAATIVGTGARSAGLYDTLEAASSQAHVHAAVERTSPPLYTTLLATGAQPFVEFAWREDTVSVPRVQTAISAIAGKIK